jgi:CubicO group peptidase (beta-lactamase class C family)
MCEPDAMASSVDLVDLVDVVDVAELKSRLDVVIEQTQFHGVAQVALQGRVSYERAAGYSDRAHRVPNTCETEFALASGTKGFTAVTIMSLVQDGVLHLDEEVHGSFGLAGSVVPPGVTVRHLLGHTSGLGDYLDEEQIVDSDDYALDVPVHRLTEPAEFLPLLRGRPPAFAPGARFKYCNSGYVVLALIIEHAAGCSYHDAVYQRVCRPAGMCQTAFPRLDELPGSAAVGYLPNRGWRTNHFHLPVRGGGDGGVYSTAADIARFWRELFAGNIVARDTVELMIHSLRGPSGSSRRYGLGFWIAEDAPTVQLEGSDPGISFRSGFAPQSGLVYTVISNTTSGAWPVVKALESAIGKPLERARPDTPTDAL